MIDATEPCPHAGQVSRNGLVADRDGVPVNGQLDKGPQIRDVLISESGLRNGDLTYGSEVASSGREEKCVSAGVPGECRQPRYVGRSGKQPRVTADGVARGCFRPAVVGEGSNPVMYLLPVAGEFIAKLLLGGDPQAFMREQVHA